MFLVFIMSFSNAKLRKFFIYFFILNNILLIFCLNIITQLRFSFKETNLPAILPPGLAPLYREWETWFWVDSRRRLRTSSRDRTAAKTIPKASGPPGVDSGSRSSQSVQERAASVKTGERDQPVVRHLLKVTFYLTGVFFY